MDYNYFARPLRWPVLECEALLFAFQLQRLAEPDARWAVANALIAGLNPSKIRRAEYLLWGDRL
jgi:hypothetical protein